MRIDEGREIGKSSKVIIGVLVLAVVISVFVGGLYLMNDSSGNISDNVKNDRNDGVLENERSSDEGSSTYTTYTNENYGLSFPYPSLWSLKTKVISNVLVISIRENSTLTDPRANVRIFVDPVASTNFDNVENQVTSFIENDENFSIIGEIERFTDDGNPVLDYSYQSTEENFNVRGRTWIMKGEDYSYEVYYAAREKFYEDYEGRLSSIIENFKII